MAVRITEAFKTAYKELFGENVDMSDENLQYVYVDALRVVKSYPEMLPGEIVSEDVSKRRRTKGEENGSYQPLNNHFKLLKGENKLFDEKASSYKTVLSYYKYIISSKESGGNDTKDSYIEQNISHELPMDFNINKNQKGENSMSEERNNEQNVQQEAINQSLKDMADKARNIVNQNGDSGDGKVTIGESGFSGVNTSKPQENTDDFEAMTKAITESIAAERPAREQWSIGTKAIHFIVPGPPTAELPFESNPKGVVPDPVAAMASFKEKLGFVEEKDENGNVVKINFTKCRQTEADLKDANTMYEQLKSSIKDPNTTWDVKVNTGYGPVKGAEVQYEDGTIQYRKMQTILQEISKDGMGFMSSPIENVQIILTLNERKSKSDNSNGRNNVTRDENAKNPFAGVASASITGTKEEKEKLYLQHKVKTEEHRVQSGLRSALSVSYDTGKKTAKGKTLYRPFTVGLNVDRYSLEAQNQELINVFGEGKGTKNSPVDPSNKAALAKMQNTLGEIMQKMAKDPAKAKHSEFLTNIAKKVKAKHDEIVRQQTDDLVANGDLD